MVPGTRHVAARMWWAQSVTDASQLPRPAQVTPAVIVSTGLIVGGCILLVAFGNHSSQEYDVGQLLELYTK